MQVAEEKIKAVPENDVDRTSEEGKASSVQFLHFSFSDRQINAFRDLSNQVVIAVGHQSYNHIVVVPRATQIALGVDFAGQ